MDRLTLPREQKAVDAGKCLPAGDSLPYWSNLALDEKFPMVPAPKGTLTFHTTQVCTPKYRRTSNSNFDLTDPHGMSMSSEYHPLHDPHLRGHFSVPLMHGHLVRNGFITASGMVICNLKEFNKYRQYLRRIFLMELVNDRRNESQKNTSRMRSNEDVSSLSKRFVEVRKRQMEKVEKQRMKQAMMAKMKVEQMERKRQELLEKQAEALKKKQEEDDRRRETLERNAEEMERRNLTLSRKLGRRDRLHSQRLEHIRRQRVLDMQKKMKDSWETRKKAQRSRLDRETEARERVKQEKEKGISIRERYLTRHRDKLMAKLEGLKSSARDAREERERICAARLAARIAAASRRAERRYRANRSPFKSEWTLKEVLKRLSFGELSGESSHEFMQMLGAAIDEAVDRATSAESEDEHELRRFASDLVETVVTKVKNEIYPAYLRLLKTDREGEKEVQDQLNDMYDQEFDQSDTGTDDELNFSNQTSDENAFDSQQRSVRFSFDESIIPVSMDSLDVLGLKPVSEHTLTPVPSPLPCDGSGSEFDFGVDGPSKITKRERKFTESLLLRLLDDLNHGRLKRDELLKLTSYCIDIVKEKKMKDHQERVTDEELAEEIVKFTLSKVIDDVRSGSISQEDLTSLTQSIIKDISGESGTDQDVTDDELDRFVSSALSSAKDYAEEDDEQIVSDSMLADFVSTTLSQLKEDLAQKKLTREELRKMAAAVASCVVENVSKGQATMAEETVKKTLNQVLENAESDKLAGAVMDKVVSAIVSTYHVMISKKEKSTHDMIEEFVTDVLSTVVEAVKAGEYSEQELKQIMSAKSVKFEKEQTDTNQSVQNLIDSLLDHIEAGKLGDKDMSEIGNVLVETGRKLLAVRGVSPTAASNADPGEMASTEVADKVVKDVIQTIQGEMEDAEFEKEALKALAASFLKVKSSSLEGISNATTIGSSVSPSYFSTMKQVSPTESSLAIDVVLAAMDRITRDLAQNNIPVQMLSSIACSLAPDSEITPSIIVSDEGFTSAETPSLPQHMRKTLMDITRLLQSNRVSYNDAKRIFGIILQAYICRDTSYRQSFTELSKDDSLMIETLISETVNTVVRNVASDLSSTVLSSESGTPLTRLSSLMSEKDVESFIYDTLHRIGKESSAESVLSRPSAPTHFPGISPEDSANVESLVRQTLIQVAKDISDGTLSESSLVDPRGDLAFLSTSQLSSQIVDLIGSVLEELVVALEKGKVSRASVAQFMEGVSPGRDFMAMDVETLHKHLLNIMEDVARRKTSSVYLHAIAEKFSAIQKRDKGKTAVMSPDLQTVGTMLSRVDANVMTQFVQATLVAILGGMQTSNFTLEQVKPGSITSLVKVETSLIARKVVDDVIQRIYRDIAEGALSVNDLVRKDSCYGDQVEKKLTEDESQLKKEESQINKKSSATTPVNTRQVSKVSSLSGSLSGNISAYVLQTLKDAVSELGRESSESGPFGGSESLVLDEFINKQLKCAVESLNELQSSKSKDENTHEPQKTSTPEEEKSPPVTRTGSSTVSEAMLDVVDDMIVSAAQDFERKESKQDRLEEPKSTECVPLAAVSSSEVSKLVLDTLKHVLSTEAVSSPSLAAKESSSEARVPISCRDSSSESVTKQHEATTGPVAEHTVAEADVDVINARKSGNEVRVSVSGQNSESVTRQLGSTTGPVFEAVVAGYEAEAEAAAAATDSDEQTASSYQATVNLLVAEVLNQTISNIKEGKLSQANLTSLVKSLSRNEIHNDEADDNLIKVLEGVKGGILGGAVSSNDIETVAREITIVSMDKESELKSVGKTKEDSDSNTSVQSMVKEVLTHIVASLSSEVGESDAITADKPTGTNANESVDTNTNRTSVCGSGVTSPGVISNLANMSIRNQPGGLTSSGPATRNSFRSLVKPDERDIISESQTSIGVVSQESSDTDTLINATYPQSVASSKSVQDDKKKPSRQKSGGVRVSSVDSLKKEKIVKESVSKDSATSKSSLSEQKQKVGKRTSRTSETSTNRKSSTQAMKSKESSKKTTAERASKTSVPAINVDGCSGSGSVTSSKIRASSSSSTGSRQEVKSKKTTKKQEGKVASEVKTKEASEDARSTGSEASQSSQVDAMHIRSVCGSHTTQIRVRDSHSEINKE